MTKRLNVADCLCHNIRKTARLLTQFYDEALRPSGLRMPQFTLMAAVAEMGAVAFVPLAAYLGLDRTTLGRNVELLVRDGLVQVDPGEQDKRQQVVRLTELGAIRLAEAMPLWEAAQRKALKKVAKGQLAPLLGQLGALGKLGDSGV